MDDTMVWSPVESWDILRVAWGDDMHGVSAFRRTAAHSRLGMGLSHIVPGLFNRSERIWYSSDCSASETGGMLAEHPLTLAGGTSILRDNNAHLKAFRPAEGYVRLSDLGSVVSDIGLVEAHDISDVMLRAVKDDLWCFDSRFPCVPAQVAAVDILDLYPEPDMRARRTSNMILRWAQGV